MKRSPKDNELMSRLGPTKFSAEGFLGSDTRHVDEIIADDLRALEAARVSKETLVAALGDAYQKARDALGGSVEIRPGVRVEFHESMGRIPSPFQGDGVFPKGEAVVTDTESGRELIITALGIDLIDKHDFFQGRGSRYRLDPMLAAEILCLH